MWAKCRKGHRINPKGLREDHTEVDHVVKVAGAQEVLTIATVLEQDKATKGHLKSQIKDLVGSHPVETSGAGVVKAQGMTP